MRVCMVVHHYPPRYQAGVELIAQRAVKWLEREGHEVEVVCIESVDTEPSGLRCRSEPFEGTTVHRLAIGLGPLHPGATISYENPIIGQWVAEHLRGTRPDLVHVQSCYLVSTSPIQAAHMLRVPIVLSLHDYWAICPWHTLRRPDGNRCSGAVTAAACTWCLMTERRRYRFADRFSGGLAGQLVMGTASLMPTRRWIGQVTRLENRRRTVRRALSQADQLTVSSGFLRERLHDLYAVPLERLNLVTYGLDLRGWQRLPRTRMDGALRIGYIGQISPPKGVHVLVAAFNQLRPSGCRPYLSIYGDLDGDPSYVRTLRRLARGNRDIAFQGRFDHARLAEVLKQVDVMIVPSQWYETGPLVTWEAFRAGIPVVATDLPNMRDQVRHEIDGLLFAPDSSRDLTRQMQRLIDAPSLVKAMSRNIGPVKSHDEEMHETLDIYHRAARDADPRREVNG